MPANQNLKSMNVQVTPEMQNYLKKVAVKRGITLSAIIRESLIEKYPKLKKENLGEVRGWQVKE